MKNKDQEWLAVQTVVFVVVDMCVYIYFHFALVREIRNIVSNGKVSLESKDD